MLRGEDLEPRLVGKRRGVEAAAQVVAAAERCGAAWREGESDHGAPPNRARGGRCGGRPERHGRGEARVRCRSSVELLPVERDGDRQRRRGLSCGCDAVDLVRRGVDHRRGVQVRAEAAAVVRAAVHASTRVQPRAGHHESWGASEGRARGWAERRDVGVPIVAEGAPASLHRRLDEAGLHQIGRWPHPARRHGRHLLVLLRVERDVQGHVRRIDLGAHLQHEMADGVHVRLQARTRAQPDAPAGSRRPVIDEQAATRHVLHTRVCHAQALRANQCGRTRGGLFSLHHALHTYASRTREVLFSRCYQQGGREGGGVERASARIGCLGRPLGA